MAVQIPRIDRINPSAALPKNDRIRGTVQDQSQEILGRTNKIVNLIDDGASVYKSYEDEKINQLSSEAEQEYTIWNNDKLNSLKHIEGDPTDAFANYEEEAKNKYDEILEKRPDLNERVKKHLSGNLSRVQNSQRIHVMKQRGMQLEVYKNNLFESTTKLKKDTLAVNAAYIQEDDAGSLLPFDQNIAEIKTLISKRGMENSTAVKLPSDAKSWDHIYKNEDGEIVKIGMTDIAKERTAKELSEGVATSVEVLLASGETSKAKILQDKYDGYLNPKQKISLAKKFGTETVKKEAYSKLDALRGITDEEISKKIALEKNGEVRDKMEIIQKSRIERRLSDRKRKSDKNYERMYNEIEQLRQSDQGFLSKEELLNNPTYKELERHLTPEKKKALFREVEEPKKISAPKDIESMQEKFFAGEFSKMSIADFSEMNSKLAVVEQRRYRRLYEQSKTGNEGSLSSRINFANKLIKDKLITSKDLDFEGKSLGQDSRELLAEVRSEIVDMISSGEALPSEKEVQERIEPFIKELRVKGILGKKRRGFFSLFSDDNEGSVNARFSKKSATSKEKRRQQILEKLKKQKR